MCAKGGFNLTKFVSNSREVMMSVLPEDRAKEIKGFVLGIDKLLIERALSIHLCIESDAFTFRIELKDKTCTRSGILATISTIFDPRSTKAHCTRRPCWKSDTSKDLSWERLGRANRWRRTLPAAAICTSLQFFHPAFSLSHSAIFLHVVLGLPRFRRPSGAQVNAVLQSLFGSFTPATCADFAALYIVRTFQFPILI